MKGYEIQELCKKAEHKPPIELIDFVFDALVYNDQVTKQDIAMFFMILFLGEDQIEG